MTRNPRTFDIKTLEMLVCPLTKTRLVLNEAQDELISLVARVAFPIRSGVPMVCLDEARNVDESEIERLSARGH